MSTASLLSCQVAVLTYRRLDDLAELLPQLIEQTATVPYDVGVAVIDNDPEATARSLVEQFAATNNVSYLHEPVPGIASARNRALAGASSADILIFIDDDERPVSGWLDGLLSLYSDRRPAAVVGPVISRFTEELDPWLVAGRFFDRRRMPTGSQIIVAATNNLLLDLKTVRQLGLRFDEDFGISGGSDTLFTRQLSSSGAVMLWHDEAVVEDVVPPHRQTREWVLQRAYRSGNSWSQTSLVLEESFLRRALLRVRLTMAGMARVAGGLVRIIIGKFSRSVTFDARGHRTIQRGAGMLSGAWGHRYLEYRREDAGEVGSHAS